MESEYLTSDSRHFTILPGFATLLCYDFLQSISNFTGVFENPVPVFSNGRSSGPSILRSIFQVWLLISVRKHEHSLFQKFG